MVVADEVSNKGRLAKDEQLRNMELMLSTLDVSNKQMLVSDVHSWNKPTIFVTAEVSPAAIRDTRLPLSLKAL